MKNKSISAVLLIIVLFFILHRFSVLSFLALKSVPSYFAYPMLKMQQIIIDPVKQIFNRWCYIAALELELKKVTHERDILLAELVEIKTEQKYINDIQELINFKKRYNNSGAIVSVLARHLSDHEQFILVDTGSRQGITKDMIAVYNNCLVGRVIEVYPWYCKVSLITDQACKVAVLCSTTGASGIHEGKNNTSFTTLEFVSHLEKVNAMDLVISSGEGLIFPQGFALGTIKNVRKGELYYSIEVTPAIDFKVINYCMLLSKSDL